MKKRMVSLIVALCMMISLFPVSVFADEGVALCAVDNTALRISSNGKPDVSSITPDPNNSDVYSVPGNWTYNKKTDTLQLLRTGYNFDFEQGGLLNQNAPEITSKIVVSSGVYLSNGVFTNAISNSGTISNSVFPDTASVSGTGSFVNCLFACEPASVQNVYVLQTEPAAAHISASLNGIPYILSTPDSKLYFTGSPSIVLDGSFSAVVITDPNGYSWRQDFNRGLIIPKEPNSTLSFKNGIPDTANAKYKLDSGTPVYFGNGWSYDPLKSTGGTLTLTDAKNYDLGNSSFYSDGVEQIDCTVSVSSFAVVTSGTLSYVYNYGTISGGTISSLENHGTITGGTFLSYTNHSGSITGGVFNGNSNLPSYAYSISMKSGSGTITAVNDINSASWDPYVVVPPSSSEQKVTLTADVDIATLNYEDIGSVVYDSSYPDGDHKTVTFTMPAEDVTLNLIKPTVTVRNNIDSTEQAPVAAKPGEEVQITAESKSGYTFLYWESNDITLSDKTQNPLTIASMPDHHITLTANYEYSKLVISDKGVPKLPSGKDWRYDEDNNTLYLEPTTRTEYDFSREPLNPGGYDIKCKIVGNENTILVGGTFDNTVENNGEITGGTYNDSVKNNGTISGGTYNDSVENNGTINNGTFKDTVKNDGTINDGTFNGKVENTENGTINGGTFKDTVDNDGKITDGTFDGGVNNGENGDISGGTFNGNVDNKGDVTGGDFNGSVDNHPGSTFEPDSDVNKTYTVTIEGGTINGKTTVKAKKGTELTAVLDTNAIPDGMAFDMWSLSSNALTGDPSVDLKAGNMTFLMPAEDVTIRAQYISSAIAEDSPGLSPLGTAALITAGAAVTGVAVWQGYKIGVELYMERELPQGTPIPTNRRELVLLLWNTAGKPEPASAELFSDIDAQDLELQKASHWAQEHQLLGVANGYNLTLFEPESAVNETDVLLGWLRTKKLLRNVETS